MGGGGKQADHLSAIEGGCNHSEIMQMPGPHPGVIGYIDISWPHGMSGIFVQKKPDRGSHGIHMPRRSRHRLG